MNTETNTTAAATVEVASSDVAIAAPLPSTIPSALGPACRWVVSADLVLESPARIAVGPDAGDGLDAMFHPSFGAPLIPGSTIAGALRAQLAAMLGTTADARDATAFQSLFGTPGTENSAPGALTVHDAVAQLGRALPREIQAGRAINSETGVALLEGTWSRSVLPAGAVFPIRLEVMTTADANGDAVLSVLVGGLEALGSGEVRLGIARNRGLGRVSCKNWRARKFPLGSAGEWNTWLASDHLNPFAGTTTQAKPTAMEALRDAGVSPFVQPISRVRRRAVIEASVTFPGTILIGGIEAEPTAPDRAQALRDGRPLIPATSLAGAFRGRALRIARSVRARQGDAEAWVARVFGSERRNPGRRNASTAEATSSRAIFTDAFIDASRPLRTTRAPLDRFTQSLAESSLPIEQPEVGGRSVVLIEYPEWDEPGLGLLLLVLKDFLSEDLPLGGNKSIGRGTVRGRATVLFLETLTTITEDDEAPSTDDAPKAKAKRKPSRRATQFPRATLEPGKAPGGDAGARINACIWAFQDAPELAMAARELIQNDNDHTSHDDDDGPDAPDSGHDEAIDAHGQPPVAD